MQLDIELVRKELDKVQSLPTLPVIATKLINMIDSEHVSMQSIGKVLVLDPALTSRLLKIVNSAYYGMRRQVDTVDLALVILGLNEIRNILLSISLIRSFQLEGTNFNQQGFWEHSIATAHFAKKIAHDMGLPTHGEEFTAGLLHDIGRLIIVQYLPEYYIEVAKTEEESELSLFEIEESVIGLTHMDLGAWLADKWNLPVHLANVIRYHHYPRLETEYPALVHLVCVADQLAHYYQLGSSRKVELDNLIALNSWDELKSLSLQNSDNNIGDYIVELSSELETIRKYMSVALE